MTLPDIVFVPYRQPDEPPRRAGIAPVAFDLSGYSDHEIQLLGHLVAAAETMNAVFREQVTSVTCELAGLLDRLVEAATGKLKEDLSNYRTLLHLQNGPWSFLPRKNHILSSNREQVAELAEQIGFKETFQHVQTYLFDFVPLPDKANFYPEDLTEDELASLGETGRQVNTMIYRKNDGTLGVQTNEEMFRDACQEAIGHLRKARALSDNISFQIYLDAKIEELNTGSEEARRLADYHWVRHNSPFDIILSTAIEVYLDNWKNFKGAASGNVTVINRDAEVLLQKIVAQVPSLEANAPWDWRREEIDPEALPRLKFVDVACWTGDYVTGPMTTIAQSLPNDEWVGKNVGTVNMVYGNTGRAVHSISGTMIANEFLPKSAVEALGEKIFDAGQLHSALHEIGHTTGRQDPDHPGEPRDYLEAEYSALEETRAELFGMWAAERIGEAGIVEPAMVQASHYSMLLSMITSLKFEPNQAHTQARTMMWHYFDERGAITRQEEDGRIRFGLDFDKLGQVIEDMLRTVANIKAAGDKAAAMALKEKYCYTDPLKPEIEERTKQAPLGRGLIFPEFVKENDRYTGELRYPAFIDQQKFMVCRYPG